jgi:hypothetical protein
MNTLTRIELDYDNTLQAALDYIRRGWAVFPVQGVLPDGSCTCQNTACENIGKHPRTRNGVKDASKDEPQGSDSRESQVCEREKALTESRCRRGSHT